jgi:DNA-binding winged helix-turn-helix (wHTH) protein
VDKQHNLECKDVCNNGWRYIERKKKIYRAKEVKKIEDEQLLCIAYIVNKH